MRRTIMLGLLAVLAPAAAGCVGQLTAPEPVPAPAAKTVTVDGGRMELTVQSAFRGTAGQVGPVLWVQLKLHSLASRKLVLPVALPYAMVDASGHRDPDRYSGMLTSQVHLGYDAEHPPLPVGLELAPGDTVVGYLAFAPPSPAFTPAAFRFDSGGATDWPLAGLPDQPVVESVRPPAGAVPAGQTVTLTGTDHASPDGPLVPTALRVAVSAPHDAEVDRTPPDGYRSVVGTVEITNVGRSAYRESVLPSLLAYDTTGRAFAPAPAIPPGMLREGAIAPGRTVRGAVSFFLPERARLSHIRFTLAGREAPGTAWWLT